MFFSGFFLFVSSSESLHKAWWQISKDSSHCWSINWPIWPFLAGLWWGMWTGGFCKTRTSVSRSSVKHNWNGLSAGFLCGRGKKSNQLTAGDLPVAVIMYCSYVVWLWWPSWQYLLLTIKRHFLPLVFSLCQVLHVYNYWQYFFSPEFLLLSLYK